MKFRDAWNVWRRKVDKALEGHTGEISGKDVSFEGTGISATNVEDAINEVNGTVGTLSSDVTALIDTVGDDNGGLVKDVNDLKTLPVLKFDIYKYTAVAGTTVANAITGLYDKFIDDVTSQLPNGIYAMPYKFIVPYSAGATVAFDTYGHWFSNTSAKTSGFNVCATRVLTSTPQYIRLVAGVVGGSLSNGARISDFNSVSGNTTTHDNDVLTNDTEISISYTLMKLTSD